MVDSTFKLQDKDAESQDPLDCLKAYVHVYYGSAKQDIDEAVNFWLDSEIKSFRDSSTEISAQLMTHFELSAGDKVQANVDSLIYKLKPINSRELNVDISGEIVYRHGNVEYCERINGTFRLKLIEKKWLICSADINEVDAKEEIIEEESNRDPNELIDIDMNKLYSMGQGDERLYFLIGLIHFSLVGVLSCCSTAFWIMFVTSGFTGLYLIKHKPQFKNYLYAYGKGAAIGTILTIVSGIINFAIGN